jgi:hypothetical protein
VVRVGGELVVGDEVARNGFAVVGAEELGRRVPELAGIAGGDGIEGVLELDIALGQEGMEVEFVV